MSAAALLAAVARLGDSCWAISAIGAALETGLLDSLGSPQGVERAARRSGLPPALVRCLLDVLTELGMAERRGHVWAAAGALTPLLVPGALALWRAELRASALQALGLWQGLGACPGASAAAEVMQARGAISAAATDLLVRTSYGRIPGLLAALRRPGAVLLDAGAGVCGASAVLARRFPQLRIIALEPNDQARRLARRHLTTAGLSKRVALRRTRAENLRLRGACDAAYIAQEYFSDPAFEGALSAMHAALRPNGYLLTTASNAKSGGLGPAIERLRAGLSGGRARSRRELRSLLIRAGYANVMVLDGSAGVRLLVCRKGD